MTPSDLKALRLRLGLDMAEVAKLIGLAGRRDVIENLEKARTWTLHSAHIEALMKIDAEFDRLVRAPEPVYAGEEFMIGFPNDGVFQELEPELYRLLRFNSVHRMLLSTIQGALAEYGDDGMIESLPSIIEIIPAKYETFRGDRPDTREMRQTWAKAHASVYRVKEGFPVLGQQEP